MSSNKHTLLFVDDEPWLSDALRASLEAKGFKCISLEDATAAWNYIEKNDVSVLVTDIMMPSGDKFLGIDSSVAGFHLVSRVRKEKSQISVICLSVIGDQEKILALKKQNVQYLRKGETPLSTAVKLIESKATGITTF